MGRCSCGDASTAVTTAGMVHSWHGDHVNRFPLLTRAIVLAAAKAARAARNGQVIRMRAFISDAGEMAQHLERMATPPLREAEQTALNLYREAHAVVAQAEGGDGTAGQGP